MHERNGLRRRPARAVGLHERLAEETDLHRVGEEFAHEFNEEFAPLDRVIHVFFKGSQGFTCFHDHLRGHRFSLFIPES